MRGISFTFLVCGTVAVLIGMAWGIQMAASGDHGLSPAHAHLNLLGWVSFAIFGFYYHLVPTAAQSRLAMVHLGLALATSMAAYLNAGLLEEALLERDAQASNPEESFREAVEMIDPDCAPRLNGLATLAWLDHRSRGETDPGQLEQIRLRASLALGQLPYHEVPFHYCKGADRYLAILGRSVPAERPSDDARSPYELLAAPILRACSRPRSLRFRWVVQSPSVKPDGSPVPGASACRMMAMAPGRSSAYQSLADTVAGRRRITRKARSRISLWSFCRARMGKSRCKVAF